MLGDRRIYTEYIQIIWRREMNWMKMKREREDKKEEKAKEER